MAKRNRVINWETEEKQLLREIIKPFIKTIEDKNLSTNTNKAKISAWAEITEKFNTVSARVRDKKQLMNQWKSTKLASKKVYSQYRKEMGKTGGGPKPPSPSPDTIEIVEMISQEFEVDSNEFDIDGIKDLTRDMEEKDLPEDETSYNMDNKKKYVIQEIDLQTNAGTSNNYKNIAIVQSDNSQGEVMQSPNTAPTPKRSAKKKEKQTDKSNSFNFSEASFNDMHNFRVLENERLQREHELRMKNMAELHSQMMTNLKLQEDYLKKMLSS